MSARDVSSSPGCSQLWVTESAGSARRTTVPLVPSEILPVHLRGPAIPHPPTRGREQADSQFKMETFCEGAVLKSTQSSLTLSGIILAGVILISTPRELNFYA